MQKAGFLITRLNYEACLCLLQKLDTDRLRGLPPKPATPNHFFKNIGQHDRTAQALNEERKKEYNQKLAEVNLIFIVHKFTTVKVLLNAQAFIRIITFHRERGGRLLETRVLKNYI